MDTFTKLATQYATKESITVLVFLIVAWVVWKLTIKLFGLIVGMARNASFLGLTAALLFVFGFGTSGYGLGEFVTRWNSKPVEQSAELIKLSQNCRDQDTAKALLELAKATESPKSQEPTAVSLADPGNGPVRINFPTDESPATIPPPPKKVESLSIPTATTLIGIGLANIIIGVCCFSKFNRKGALA